MDNPEAAASTEIAPDPANPDPSGPASPASPPGFKKCFICIRDRGHWRKYCDRCRKFVYRAGKKSAHVKALIRDYDPVTDRFLDHYTHEPLVEDDPKDPRYLVFDHMEPGDESDENLVITMQVYNESKTDMDYEEYIAFCREVVRAHDTGEFDGRVLDFKHWFRMRRR